MSFHPEVLAFEQRLRDRLAHTDDSDPRPLAELELPSQLTPGWRANLLQSLKPASVLVPILRRGDTHTLLLTRRAETLRTHQGQISFPGGRPDEGDAGRAGTALREAQEEVGLLPAQVEVVGYLDDFPTMTGFRITPVVGLIRGEPAFVHHPDEVAEVFEVPLPWLLDPDNYQRKVFTRDGLEIPYMELQFGSYRIWGATAGILWNLTRCLSET